jgi:hypothetical protein
MRALTFEYVKQFFEERNCELLETEYHNAHHIMNYKCECENISQISYNNFKKGKRCATCKGGVRLNFDDVKNYFKEQGCELLSTEYINSQTLMKYKCNCGNISETSYAPFKKGHRCSLCGGNEKYTYEDVKNYFKEQECELLISKTEYINSNTIMKFKCKCGNISHTNFSHFKNSDRRCMSCGFEKHSKSSIKFKDYIFESGNISKIQGYEHIALDELIQIYKESEIKTARIDMPFINYYFDKKTRRYYPDIFIESENKLIEVKSDYTYKKELIKNIHKALAARKLGYSFEIWIYDRNKIKLII